MNLSQKNYIMIEKEIVDVLCAFDKLWSYFLVSKVIVQNDNSTLRYIIDKNDAKLRFIRSIMFIQEFDFEVKANNHVKNKVPDY